MNRICGPAIPVQRSNQLSYIESSCRALTTSSCTYVNLDIFDGCVYESLRIENENRQQGFMHDIIIFWIHNQWV